MASCGALLFDQRDKSAHVFGVTIPSWVVESWKQKRKNQYITETELLPILFAKRTWRDKMIHSKVLAFVDSKPVSSCVYPVTLMWWPATTSLETLSRKKLQHRLGNGSQVCPLNVTLWMHHLGVGLRKPQPSGMLPFIGQRVPVIRGSDDKWGWVPLAPDSTCTVLRSPHSSEKSILRQHGRS